MPCLHIVFCANNNYIPYIGINLQNIVKIHSNTSYFIEFHIITDKVSPRNKKNLELIINNNDNFSLKFYIIQDLEIEGLITSKYTKYAWYRILIPDILSQNLEKVLYLDVDTLVCSDLSKLYEINLNDVAIAGVIDDNTLRLDHYQRLNYDPCKLYVCSGVLMMNLEYWRKNNLKKRIIDWAKSNEKKLLYPDQDAINYVCQNSKIILPLKYGILNDFFIKEEFYKSKIKNQLIEAFNHPVIIHYAGYSPWIKDAEDHIFKHLWIEASNSIKYKVKSVYKTKGLKKFRIMLWNFFHPQIIRTKISINEIKYKLDRINE